MVNNQLRSWSPAHVDVATRQLLDELKPLKLGALELWSEANGIPLRRFSAVVNRSTSPIEARVLITLTLPKTSRLPPRLDINGPEREFFLMLEEIKRQSLGALELYCQEHDVPLQVHYSLIRSGAREPMPTDVPTLNVYVSATTLKPPEPVVKPVRKRRAKIEWLTPKEPSDVRTE